jgi:ketosteroid isomerase-like protein
MFLILYWLAQALWNAATTFSSGLEQASIIALAVFGFVAYRLWQATRDVLPESEVEQIRRLVDKRVEAVRAKDVSGATSMAASDFVLFDVVNPLQATGPDASRRRAEEWFATFEGPIDYEIRDLRITASCDVGFSHGLNHVSAKTTDGARLDMWWRGTVCYRKVDGSWMATHEHNSVPFDMTKAKAPLDLIPQGYVDWMVGC